MKNIILWLNEKDERWFFGTIKKLKDDKQFWHNDKGEILIWNNVKDGRWTKFCHNEKGKIW